MKRREFVLAGAALAYGKSGPVSLFNGRSLAGWNVEGKAVWQVADGAIVGRQGPAGESGDLFTDKQWKDFDLELEWRMKWPGNSGVWFRYTNAKAAYQADILDQSSHPGVLSGSLYCMGKAFIAENRNAASVRKDGWNRMRIRAVGEEITIEQNGIAVVRVRDATFPGAGRIGIQLHAGKDYEGMEVRVRNVRIQSLD